MWFTANLRSLWELLSVMDNRDKCHGLLSWIPRHLHRFWLMVYNTYQKDGSKLIRSQEDKLSPESIWSIYLNEISQLDECWDYTLKPHSFLKAARVVYHQISQAAYWEFSVLQLIRFFCNCVEGSLCLEILLCFSTLRFGSLGSELRTDPLPKGNPWLVLQVHL